MKIVKLLSVLALVGVAFSTGYVLRGRHSRNSTALDGRPVLYWVDPMHPAYKSDSPGIAPDCGMALEPVYADEALPPKAPPPAARGDAGHPAAMPLGTVRIAPDRQQLIGVKFEEARVDGEGRDIRTVGQVTIDETRVGHVHTRVEGWADSVLVDFTGDLVRKGQPMLTVYSPDMLASQQELLLAAKARDQMKDNPLADAARHGEALFDAARRRLQLWDLSEAQIQQVLDTGKPIRSITVEAPMSGYITARNVFPNQKVTPESDLYTIVDLSHVWVLAAVFESDMSLVRNGGSATVTLPYASQAPLAARVNYIQPEIDPTTRALKVRLDVANAGMRLKPNMYVDVTFSAPAGRRLTVPADAVVDTGSRQTVFVDRGNGYLEPRQVTTAERRGDRVAIRSGLAAGERVVASGTFLVDSESQLKAALIAMSTSPDKGAAPDHHHETAPAAKDRTEPRHD